MRRKVLVIGLDGATFDLIRPWAEEGKLENFKRLLKEGVSGDLESVFPPITASAWTSFLTGVNPGKHGVFDFSKRKSKSYAREMINSSSIRAKTLLNLLNDTGLRMGLINVPLTYPPEEVKGFVVAGMLTPSLTSEFTHPKSLKNQLKSMEYEIEEHFNPKRREDEGYVRDYLKRLFRRISKREKAAFHLSERYDVDCLVVVFTALDRVSHNFWHFFDEKHPRHQKGEFEDVISSCYQKIDEMIGEFTHSRNERETLILISDHGFSHLRKRIHINNWLESLGLLNTTLKFRLLRFLREILNFIKFRKFGTFFYNHMVTLFLKRGGVFGNLRGKYEDFISGFIDWRKTRAYLTSILEQGIYINLKGREPKGTVEADEYEALRDYIIEKLLELKDEDTGERIVKKVFKREEVYSGDYLSDAPDVVFLLKKGYQCTNKLKFESSNTNFLSDSDLSGFHRMNGIFLIKGSNIKKGIEILNAKIVDVAPTILYVLGVPIPKYMDGRVLYEVFEEDFFKKNPPRYIDLELESKREKEIYSEKDRERIKERLKGLGYV